MNTDYFRRVAPNPARARARAFQESAYALFSTVEVRQTQSNRGLRRGMVGVVLDQFGSPPTHYSVAVAEAYSFGIFAAQHLRRPREVLPPAPSPHARAASRADLMEDAGYRYFGNDTDQEDVYHASSISHLDAQIRQAVSTASTRIIDDYPDFTKRYGPILDVTFPIQGPNGRWIQMLTGWHYPKVAGSDIACRPILLAVMPLRLLGSADETAFIKPITRSLIELTVTPRIAPLSPRLPTEIWAEIARFCALDGLNALSPVCQAMRLSVDEECRRPERSKQCSLQLGRLKGSAWFDAIHSCRHLLRSMEGQIPIPSDASTNTLAAFSQLISGGRARGVITFDAQVPVERVHSVPATIDAHWHLNDWRSLLSRQDLPPIPSSLCSLSLDLKMASGAGLRDLFSMVSSQTKLNLFIETFAPSPGSIPTPAPGQLQELCLPARTARGGHLSAWLKLPGLTFLSLLDESDEGHLDRDLRPVALRPSVHLSSSLESLGCGPRMFSFFAGLENLIFLRHLSLHGSGLAIAVERLRCFPFLEDVELDDDGSAEMPEHRHEMSLGEAMARWPLGHAVKNLRVKSASIGWHFGQIQWPKHLIELDLSFCVLGPAIRRLQRLDSLRRLDLVCTEVDQAIFDTPWPSRIKEVDIDISDIPSGSVHALVERFPSILFNFHDL